MSYVQTHPKIHDVPTHRGDQTSNIWISRSRSISFPDRSFEWRGLRFLTWIFVWNCGDSCENVINMYRGYRENLFWWVLQHCTGSARLVWGRLRVHSSFHLFKSICVFCVFLFSSCPFLYRDYRENLLEILAVAIVLSPISSVCGLCLICVQIFYVCRLFSCKHILSQKIIPNVTLCICFVSAVVVWGGYE